MKRSSWPLRIVRIIVLVGLAAMFMYLFYQQASGKFSSDLEAHIRRALMEGKDTYSLVQALLGFSYTQGGPLGTALLLTSIEIGTLVLCEQFMRRLLPDTNPAVVFVFSLVINFVGCVYLPIISPHFSKGVSIANVWHNSTYLGMKLFSLAALWSYLRFMGELESKHKVLDWVLFSVFVILSATAKPSFVIVFGPAVVVFCVVALVREGVSSLKRSLALSVPFFAIVGVLLYQYTVLFTQVSSSGIGFGFAVVWRHTHPFFPLAMLQSYAFPLLVLLFCWKKNKGDFNYRLSLLMFVFALCIFLFVNETGHRTYHGNFGWSQKFALYYWFITSVVVFVRTYGHKFSFFGMEGAPADAPSMAQGTVAPAVMACQSEEAGKTADSKDALSVADASGEAVLADSSAADGDVVSKPAFWPEVFTLLVLGAHLITGLVYLSRLLVGRGF